MKVEIRVDESLDENQVIILTPELNKESLALKERIENENPMVLTGFYEDKLEFINPDDIVRIYANEKKVFALTMDKLYLLRLPLYKVYERLDKNKFIRISNSEIINLRKSKSFDLAYIGTISIEMENGDICYVSRRTLKKVKEILGI